MRLDLTLLVRDGLQSLAPVQLQRRTQQRRQHDPFRPYPLRAFRQSMRLKRPRRRLIQPHQAPTEAGDVERQHEIGRGGGGVGGRRGSCASYMVGTNDVSTARSYSDASKNILAERHILM